MTESVWSVVAFSFLAAIIGAVAGSILGLNGFAQPVGNTPLNQTPRLKNLGWLLSGFFVMYLADPKRIGFPADFPFFRWPFIGYGVGAVLGVVGSISWMAHSITQSVQSLNSQLPEGHKVDAHFLRREYLTYGKARFDERLEKARTDAIQARDQQKRELEIAREKRELEIARDQRKRELEIARNQRKRDLEIGANCSAAECIYNATNALGVQRKLNDGPLMDALLKAICAKAAAATSEVVDLKGSYMAFVPERKAASFIEKALFTTGMAGRYSGYLELKRGSVRVNREVVLPIAVVPGAALPGPPEAVISQGFFVMNTRDIKFQPQVVPEVREEMNNFYKQPYFEQIASVTTIPVSDGKTLHGVMNIESPKPDLFGERRDALNDVVETLQPLIALLSIFD